MNDATPLTPSSERETGQMLTSIFNTFEGMDVILSRDTLSCLD